jgi:transposase
MKYITGFDRSQMTIFPVSLDEAIEETNIVRIIDLFVDSLDIVKMGFRVNHNEEGRPAYHPKDLLKIFIYGYKNGIRSSRSLERECKRNIEMMWLVCSLAPDHNTISNFRRDNPKAIKKVFRHTVEIAKNFELIGGELLAGDSTKFRAQNSKKNNYNQKKIERHLNYIDEKLNEYNEVLSKADGDADKEVFEQEIQKHKERREKYEGLEQELASSDEVQISTTDPDSRQMIVRNNITEVAYNVQTTVDGKHNLPIDYKVTNTNDSKAMGNMLQRSKSILGHNNFTCLYDKGYHTGSEFAIADSLNIETLVAIPALPSSSHAPDPQYDVEHFTYDEENDTYICPQGKTMTTSGTWHAQKSTNGKVSAYFKNYTTPECKRCDVRHLCTKSKINGKQVRRSEYAKNIEANKQRIEKSGELYKQRQAIVEHPYGTIKRQWGFSYIITKKFIKRAESDVGFMFTVYNLTRIINIIGITALKEYLQGLALYFYEIIIKAKLQLAILKKDYFTLKPQEYIARIA